MNEAVARMLARYEYRRLEDYTRALREILQEMALLGLWRSRFFEKAAFYGGTALRIFHGLDRFSEDLDFSLLEPDPGFVLSRYTSSLEREIRAFGFDVTVTEKVKQAAGPVRSAFLKADTMRQLLTVQVGPDLVRELPRGQAIRIRLEVDTDPPPGFSTEARYLLHPIPFTVRTYVLPDLFAGKMHALLCRQWKTRVKGRDWYDFVWYAANHPELDLPHLEQRMRQSGHWKEQAPMTKTDLDRLLVAAIDRLDVDRARKEVEPFILNPEALTVWSRDFFLDVAGRIRIQP
ncbi:MAG: hypothetical protein CVU61_11935 [Deltaproteobacteria bacterium HGW-Deltaproteobacteria-19]|jgi:predicted nucleotidyltransferase component of viral defense system|nr:MAG: hypothetical protein CVU61_11935 [Deltaproteobacteria bacterium HGW-Deltaproteobacteria-19]